MIEARKEREIILLDLTKQEKADVGQLKTAIEQAEESKVNATYVKKAKQFLEMMEYVEEFENFIKTAVADKNKEQL